MHTVALKSGTVSFSGSGYIKINNSTYYAGSTIYFNQYDAIFFYISHGMNSAGKVMNNITWNFDDELGSTLDGYTPITSIVCEDNKGFVEVSTSVVAQKSGTLFFAGNGTVTVNSRSYSAGDIISFSKGDTIKFYIPHQGKTAGKRMNKINWTFG